MGAFIVSGCNAGNYPAPMSDNDVKSKIGAMPAQQQMDFVANAPMPASEKVKQIKEIEAKTGEKYAKPYPGETSGVPSAAKG